MMNSLLVRFRFLAALRSGAVFALTIALLGMTPQANAAPLITLTQGSAVTTITSAIFHPDGITISIESEQAGYLSHVGAFTAHFSYLAVGTPVAIAIVGNGTLTTGNGDKIFLAASIVELGADYPRTLDGTLTITGGTGRYKGATGALVVHGIDEESLTDTITISGTIVTAGSLLGGLLR
ncbi:MAG TPA: hypothetical protein VHO24_18605 [Opitutaceae bacterium]|nr:hypothetical protein [Opitutaceae bacterium]